MTTVMDFADCEGRFGGDGRPRDADPPPHGRGAAMHDEPTLPKSQRQGRRIGPVAGSSPLGERARIDLPHGVRPATAALAPKGGRVASVVDLPVVEPLALAYLPPVEGHAQQLADWLQRQLAELREREASVATQEEDLAQKLEGARSWLDEQRSALEARERALDTLARPTADADPALIARLAERERELDARHAQLDEASLGAADELARIAQRQALVDRQAATLAEREREIEATALALAEERRETRRIAAEAEARAAEAVALGEGVREAQTDLDARERRLEARAIEIQTAIERYQRLGISEQRIAELEERAAGAAARERGLEDAEALVAQDRAALAARREHFERHVNETQHALDNERRQFESNHASQRAEAKRWADDQSSREAELDRREESLRRLQAELQGTQREVLEMRLATEETWAQLTGVLAPAALSRSIARVRAELADYYATSLREIAEGRGALRDAAMKVTDEFRRLAERRAALEEWANRRHAELGAAAERLECREHELDRQQRSYEEMEARWAAERNDLREQVRTLLREMRTEPLRSAA
jgi:hypothetical protein